MFRSWPDDRKNQLLYLPQNLPDEKSGRDPFRHLTFEAAQFAGVADFTGRKILGRLDFARANFGQPPIFDEYEGEQLNFYGAKIEFAGTLHFHILRWRSVSTRGWSTSSPTARRLRVFRAFAEETKNHDLERNLYIEERKIERGFLFKAVR